MNGYDPKLLEAWFRFLAETSRSQGQAQEALSGLSERFSPEAWAEMSRAWLPWGDAEELPSWGERYLAALGLVPKHRVEALERHNEVLRRKLEEAERLLATQAQGEVAREVVEAWQRTVEATIATQRRWFLSWLGEPDEPEER